MSTTRKKEPIAGRMARVSARRPWVTVGVWVVIVALALVASSTLLSGALTTEQSMSGNPDSVVGQKLLEEKMPGYDVDRETVVIDSELSADDPVYQAFVTELQDEIDALGDTVVVQTISYYQVGAPNMVSEDGHAQLLSVEMAGTPEEATENVAEVLAVVEAADEDARFTVASVGPASIDHDFVEISEKDLRVGEAYGIGAALVVLVLVFASVVSAAVPLVLAVMSILTAVGLTALLGTVWDFSFFIVNMISMMGLAVGIDYSLFVISRFREERLHGGSVVDAVVATGSTASQAVLISGTTVIFALAGMLLVPASIFSSLGVGAILVVVVAVLATLTLLPAVLTLLGDRVNAMRLPVLGRSIDRSGDPESGVWGRLAHAVMRRPVVSVVVSSAILLALAAPYLEIEIGSNTGATAIPEGAPSRVAYQLLEDKFGAGDMTPAQIAIDGNANDPGVSSAIASLQARLAADADFGPGQLDVAPDGSAALLTVPISSDGTTEELDTAVRHLRSVIIPEEFSGVDVAAYVTGDVASNMDFADLVDRSMPWVLGLVLLMSFVLLMVVFRSIAVPVKALIMNLLSVGASYGLMVAVFQKGYLIDLFGFQRSDVIEAWIPLFLFCVLFGLSMDYHVFLLSRIRERYVETGDNAGSVAFGVGTTARIITGAALIMVAVFGGFASGSMVMFQQMGFGLAVAVLLDATLIRSVLVPASMRLLGRANWWLPRSLAWLPEVELERSVRPQACSEEPAPARG